MEVVENTVDGLAVGSCSVRIGSSRGHEMVEPDDVAAIVRLHKLGWGTRRISSELGLSRNTVRKFVRSGGWHAYQTPARRRKLDGLDDWLRERFKLHGGNADVVRQDLALEKGIAVSLRTVERAVQPYRQELEAERRASVRYETRPGCQLQIDFGEKSVLIGASTVRVYLFVATLGFSRRLHVRAFLSCGQTSWFEGLESTFRAFGGVTEVVLFDNARALVDRHNAETREVVFNDKLQAFAKHWTFTPRACLPYRARTKGKVERGVGYVKRNALAGRSFETFEALEAHLSQWTREVADTRCHGTMGEAPITVFERDEAHCLKDVSGVPPFQVMREVLRTVQSDCTVVVSENHYSVPWRLIGERASIVVDESQVRIFHGGKEMARHDRLVGKRGRSIQTEHFDGVAGAKTQAGPSDAIVRHTRGHGSPTQNEGFAGPQPLPLKDDEPIPPPPSLLRPLAEYEALVGGGW